MQIVHNVIIIGPGPTKDDIPWHPLVRQYFPKAKCVLSNDTVSPLSNVSFSSTTERLSSVDGH